MSKYIVRLGPSFTFAGNSVMRESAIAHEFAYRGLSADDLSAAETWRRFFDCKEAEDFEEIGIKEEWRDLENPLCACVQEGRWTPLTRAARLVVERVPEAS